MRCNNSRVEEGMMYRISNGWREFAYDHSVKLNDKLVFTFVSPSHFVAEFATGAMRPTQDGKKYPWKKQRGQAWLDYSKNVQRVAESNSNGVSGLVKGSASTSRGSTTTTSPPSFTKVLTSKYEIHTSVRACQLSLPRLFCDEHNVPNNVTMTDSAGHTLWHMRSNNRASKRGVYRISNGWREFAYDHSLKLNDKLVFTFIPPSHFVVKFATGVMRPTRDGKKYPWIRRSNSSSINVEAQARVTTSLPNSNKQTLDDDILYQSSTVKVEDRNNILKDSTSKLPSFSEPTHLECKNPDGTLYLQLLDSDGDVTDEDEEIAHGYN